MLRQPSLILIFFTIFLDLMGFGLLLPLLPSVTQDMGVPTAVIGFVTASYSLMQFLTAPLWGSLSDRIGRRPVLLISIASSTVGYLLLATSQGIAGLIISRILAGTGAANVAVGQAYIADITPEDRRAQAMALIGVAFGIGFVIGPFIGGLVQSQLGFAGVGFVAAGFSGLDLLLTWLLLPESLAVKRPDTPLGLVSFDGVARATAARPAGYMVMLTFLYVFTLANLQTSLPLLADNLYHLSKSTISYIFSFMGTISATVQGLLVGPLTRRFGETPLTLVGSLLMAVGFGLVPFIPHRSPEIFAGLAILGVFISGFALINPTKTALITNHTPAEERGDMLGTTLSVGALARIFGPIAGSTTYHLHHALPCLLGVGFMLLGCWLSWKFRKHNQHRV